MVLKKTSSGHLTIISGLPARHETTKSEFMISRGSGCPETKGIPPLPVTLLFLLIPNRNIRSYPACTLISRGWGRTDTGILSERSYAPRGRLLLPYNDKAKKYFIQIVICPISTRISIFREKKRIPACIFSRCPSTSLRVSFGKRDIFPKETRRRPEQDPKETGFAPDKSGQKRTKAPLL